MIDVQNLSFHYHGNQDSAVKDVSFQIDQGEIFGFLGPSGAGKSATHNMLTGGLSN